MTEELKYKVGDKFLVEAEVEIVRPTSEYQYGLTYSKTGNFIRWVTEGELDKVSVTNPPKPKIRQFVMDWYEQVKYIRKDWTTFQWLDTNLLPESINKWLIGVNRLEREHALATLIAYGPEAVEVEKEKKYRVKLKATRQYLKRYAEGVIFSIIVDYAEVDYYKHFKFTKQELTESGFEGVFDNEMFEVEEVE